MLDEMRIHDEQLDASDIRQLESADEIAHFFAKLRYDVDERTNIPDYAVLGMGSEEMRQHILKVELIGKDPIDGDISIYLFEVRSVTAKLRNDIARRFRERPENAILVLTKDYEDLEFVLLERVVSKSQSRRVALKQAIRPLPLTVNRQNPGRVALRVLKRFTFTEEDAAYQWEKLRSAYMLAEWSEEYFNNRALFSDYYLKERLTDPQITPEWNEDVRPVGREIYKHIVTARKDYTSQTANTIRQGLYEPVFKLLGFGFTKWKPGSSSAETADYLLSPPGDPSRPIAAALTYVWNRNLDTVDVSRERPEDDGGTPFEIPGARVVSLLEKQVAPWVIVTNGKLWRLYSSTASNKATNYYEVDLEEAIAANDQITALKYWWLMFRQEAFTGFLNKLLKNSTDYAKELGERLKDRVFVDIFPQFAKGFIADMRAKGASDFDAETLTTVFSGTMTFLYRLMFILYAESLELLPVYEVHGYREKSLYHMKDEIARTSGIVLDESPDRLGKQYKTSSTELYDRLQALFTVIDQGSDELNMPTYNGGLFSPGTEGGTFLATYAIPDRDLALGLDRLTRDVDTRTQGLVFIDFKSLGVRHLGSIYEGLLEFKLRIAGEKLAITKEKGKEVYKPAKQVQKPLGTIDTGEVYLENDKQERQATGSYYTPDYIVKYIVRHTVGPVLDRKFAALGKRLREAQRGYRKYARLVEARRKAIGRDESATVYWNEPEMRNLVDDCLNVRVLDPAMGSGHFLVEVVDYVGNRLIDFLNGWSENPVWAFLEQTRDDILNDMERQKVTIDADRLTRVALLKRAVLKRCVYGVDLNIMAVDLAKVSLWLDAFTLGAPLSFLDHHLKPGNSLIGARVEDVQKALEGNLTLFSRNKFVGVMLATDLMRQVSYLSDNTIEQTRRSAQAYSDARDHLAPYKRVLDVYTSRWFGNTPSKSRKGTTFDPTIEFLRRDNTQAWLEDPYNPKNSLPDDDYMQVGLVAKTAQKTAEEKRFFHWELEFPEVFFAPSKPGGQDVQLKKDGGFSAVIGNPPYISTADIAQDQRVFYRTSFKTCGKEINTFALFSEQALLLTSNYDRIGYIVPDSYLYVDSYKELRFLFLEKCIIGRIAEIPGGAFDDATIGNSVVYIVEQNENIKIRKDYIVKVDIYVPPDTLQQVEQFSQKLFAEYPNKIFLTNSSLGALLLQLLNNNKKLKDIARLRDGVKTGRNTEFLSYKPTSPLHKPVLSNADIERYGFAWPGTYLLYDRDKLARPREEDIFLAPEKLIIRQTGDRLIAAYDDSQYYSLDNTRLVVSQLEDVSPLYLLALVNSRLLSFLHQVISGELDRVFAQVRIANLELLPVKLFESATPSDIRKTTFKGIVKLFEAKKDIQLIDIIIQISKKQMFDVIYDIIVYMSQIIIGLKKEKRKEINRFLYWLNNKLRVISDDSENLNIYRFSGNKERAFSDFIGDYEKGVSHLEFKAKKSEDDFYYFLYKNRNRFAVSLSDVEGEIQREYEKSLETLIPIKCELARTDALIDKIVYRLYGLTDEEIELIERPQYEQALADAKAQVVTDEKITDDEEKIEKIAAGILPAAKRFFERVEPTSVEAILDSELPHWRSLPPDAPTFLLTGDYNLHALPEHMDFSASVIPYTKAIETVLYERIFAPFRDSSGYTDTDCNNKFLRDFMRNEKKLTLGSFMIILSSTEPALRTFISRAYPDAAQRVFGAKGLVAILNDKDMRDIRNKAAHDEVLSRDEAQQTRSWAMQLLGQV